MDLLRTRTVLLLAALAAGTAFCASAKPWGAPKGGASFGHLGIPPQARAAALAGGGVAWSGEGLSSMQPALAGSESLRLDFSRAWMPEEVGARLDRFELSGGAGRNGFSVSGTLLDYDDLDGYTEDDVSAGSYGAGAWHLALAWSRSLGPVRWGAELSGGNAEIEDYDSWIGMASFGIVCSLPLGFRAGTALRHVGWATPFRNDEPTLPSELVVGIAQGGRLSSGFLAWTAGVDVRRRNGDGLAAIVSGEAVLHDSFAIRAGYPFGEDEPGISVGGALLLRWVDVEYALASHGLYGARHHLGLAIRL